MKYKGSEHRTTLDFTVGLKMGSGRLCNKQGECFEGVDKGNVCWSVVGISVKCSYIITFNIKHVTRMLDP